MTKSDIFELIGGSSCPFDNPIKVHTGFDIDLSEIGTWCDKHCKGQWHNGMPNPAYWDFELDVDAAYFKLVWGA